LWALLSIAASFPATSASASTPVGARVLVQEWDPRTPDAQSVKVLVDDPAVVSKALADAWASARDPICNTLRAWLGKPGIAKGQSLYNIDCRLPANPAFTVQSASPNLLHATFAINGSSVTATSTVPDPLPRSLDPRFSLTLDASFTVGLEVQKDPANTLRASTALFRLSGAKIDSHNASGDAIKFVVDDLIPFFGGPNFRAMAENEVNKVSANVASTFNAAMAPVNAKLRGPNELVRIGVWGRPNRITVAFAPREIPPPGGGTVTGKVSWDPAQYRPKDCSSFQFPVTVQTGPAPLLNPDNYTVVGPAPMRKVGTSSVAPSNADCLYSITGLPQGWPARIQPEVDGVQRVQTGGNTFFKRSVGLAPDGWSGDVVANAADRNYRVAEQIRPTSVPQHREAAGRDPLGPVSRDRLQDRVANPAVRSTTESLNAQAATPAVTNPVTTAPNAARSTSTATTSAATGNAVTNPAVTNNALTSNAAKGGTPTTTTTAPNPATTTSTATSSVTRVQSPTSGITTRPDASTATAVTRLPSTTQRTTAVPDSAFSR
jgi:hypothetical protein